MSVGKVLFRTLSKAISRFPKSKIPLTGIVDTPLRPHSLIAHGLPKDTFRASGDGALDGGIADGFSALKKLSVQFKVLEDCGELTRQALAAWYSLAEKYDHEYDSVFKHCLAIEDAALMLPEVAQAEARWLDSDGDPDSEPCQGDLQPFSLDSLTEHVSNLAPDGLFTGISNLKATPLTPVRDLAHVWQQLLYINEVLVKKLRFRHEPFEWVYEGLAPLFVSEVLKTRKGTPLSVAILCMCVARRLGLPLTLICSPVHGQAMTEQMELPAHIKLRQQASLATAPELDTWILCFTGTGADSDSPQQICWNPVEGTVMTSQEGNEKHLTTQNDLPWHNYRTLQIWISMLRVAITAHQRRGDSDAVAHCLYQLLALDPSAPEWAQTLAGPQVL